MGADPGERQDCPRPPDDGDSENNSRLDSPFMTGRDTLNLTGADLPPYR